MENISDVREIVKNIFDRVKGLLEEEEGEFLYNIAKDCKGRKGAIVEIGSWKGRSTICLGKGSKAGNKIKIYAIDPHRGTPRKKLTLIPYYYKRAN